ncbi:MAG: hypothetical protein AAF738_00755 [Bacteroidota bacterium]
MTYKIYPGKKGIYHGMQEGRKAFSLSFPIWWSNEAYVDVMNESYYIEKKNFWGLSFRISKDDSTVGMLSYSHHLTNGGLMLDLVNESGNTLKLMLKARGMCKPRLEVWRDQQDHLFTIRYQYVDYWGSDMKYHIEQHTTESLYFSEDGLAGLLSYAARLYSKQMGLF